MPNLRLSDTDVEALIDYMDASARQRVKPFERLLKGIAKVAVKSKTVNNLGCVGQNHVKQYFPTSYAYCPQGISAN